MSIVINKKTDRFFISINKVGGHSFIMLGVYDQNNVQHLLCRVGKFVANDEAPNCWSAMNFLCNALFFTNKARLADEGVSRRSKGAKPITYQAYDINYEQYLEFVQVLESLQTLKNKFECYKPKKVDGDEVTLELTSEQTFSSKSADKIKESVCELRLGNTCRHSAIALVEETQHAPVASLVSNNFFTRLPYETVLEYGTPSKGIPFYVLPVSPAAFPELEETKKKVITKLYARMEHMLRIETHSRPTQDKFLKLKDLYLQILGPQKELSLDELLKSIQNWRQQNESTLTVLRKTYFWDSFFTRKSATMSLISEVEHDLQMAQVK